MIPCFLSLGSNIGDRLSNLHKAIDYISDSQENIITSKSPIYESKAMYNNNLDRFYNCVIKITTNLLIQSIKLDYVL